jgi:hypothetical protein
MSDATANLTISCTPVSPAIGTIYGMAMMVRSPRSDSSITVMINPAALDYKEHPVDTQHVQVRQATAMGITDETYTFYFDLHGEYAHDAMVGGQAYHIRLLAVGADEFDGQQFPRYEFMITRL